MILQSQIYFSEPVYQNHTISTQYIHAKGIDMILGSIITTNPYSWLEKSKETYYTNALQKEELGDLYQKENIITSEYEHEGNECYHYFSDDLKEFIKGLNYLIDKKDYLLKV